MRASQTSKYHDSIENTICLSSKKIVKCSHSEDNVCGCLWNETRISCNMWLLNHKEYMSPHYYF